MGYQGDDRGRRYEIRLAGRLGPALRLAFPDLQAIVEPRHCVLLVPADGPDLATLLARLRVRHVEVVRARLRGTVTPEAVRPAIAQAGVSPSARVEATISWGNSEPVEAWP